MCVWLAGEREHLSHISLVSNSLLSLTFVRCDLCRTLNCISVSLAQDEVELTLSRAPCHHSSEKVTPSSFSQVFLVAKGDDNADKINFPMAEMTPRTTGDNIIVSMRESGGWWGKLGKLQRAKSRIWKYLNNWEFGRSNVILRVSKDKNVINKKLFEINQTFLLPQRENWVKRWRKKNMIITNGH